MYVWIMSVCVQKMHKDEITWNVDILYYDQQNFETTLLILLRDSFLKNTESTPEISHLTSVPKP